MIYFCQMPVRDRKRGRLREKKTKQVKRVGVYFNLHKSCWRFQEQLASSVARLNLENRIKAACLMSQVDCSHLPKKKLHSGKMVSEVDCSDPHKKAHSDHPDFAPASVTGLSAIACEWETNTLSGRAPLLLLLVMVNHDILHQYQVLYRYLQYPSRNISRYSSVSQK